MAATEPIRSKKQLKELADYYLEKGQLRNYTLIVMGVYTALRISDLLRLTWSDVYDEERQTFHTHITIIEKKTKKPKAIALNKQILGALRQLYLHRRGEFIFANNRKDAKGSAGCRHGALFGQQCQPLVWMVKSLVTPYVKPGAIMR